MKHKTIKTDKATVLALELPEEAKNVNTSMSNKCLIYDTPWSHVCADLPEGNWQLLGRLPDITEGQWKDVVDDYDNGYFYYPDGYKDTCDTATESGLSLMQANEVYFENPIVIIDGTIKENNITWLKVQEKVWDKERCYLFIKAG